MISIARIFGAPVTDPQGNSAAITPGSDGLIADEKEALKVAKKIGYPVTIKASAGGGGKGMRVARDPDDFLRSFQLARSEALSAFGNGDVYVEKFLERPRHVTLASIIIDPDNGGLN